MPLFDAYVIVDWSAASVPTTGADSIWYAEYRREESRAVAGDPVNAATRAEATANIADRVACLAASGRRVLVGFDFPFGFPAGTARALGLAGVPWQATWRMLGHAIEDADDNTNNRFELAEDLNGRISGEPFPFWGHPPTQRRQGLAPGRLRDHRPGEPAERRLCEDRVRRAQPVWKLAYPGSVGSQALTGIPRVMEIRNDARIAGTSGVWPFETGLADDPGKAVVLAEVYPSLFGADPLDGLPKDAGQVTATARGLAALDDDGELRDLLAADSGLTEAERHAIETEEAWILGVGAGPGS